MRVPPLACQPVAGAARRGHFMRMADKDKAADREREERLAAALRENLRRRKAQARQLQNPDDENQP